MIDIAKRKHMLEEKLQELTVRAEHIKDDLRQPSDDDWEENATESANDEVLQEIGGVTTDEIRQIKLALIRIEEGTYSDCARCGEPIGENRLDAIPHASLCVKCA